MKFLITQVSQSLRYVFFDPFSHMFPVRIKKSNTVCIYNLGPLHAPPSLHYQTEKKGTTVGAGSLSPCLYE